MTLLSAALEFGGDWSGSPPEEAALVLRRTRAACLGDVALLSDRQPDRLKIVSRLNCAPHIWLESATSATVVIDGSVRDWGRMAYQFGHELGHVVCNSWQVEAVPLNPTQWLEECLAEAFSLRGLALLADAWEEDPPLADDRDYAKQLRRYRAALIVPYRTGGKPAASAMSNWLAVNRSALENGIGGRPGTGPVMLTILSELDRDRRCVAGLGAVNRWPARAAAPLEEYLAAWQASCADLRLPGLLPRRLGELFFADEVPAPPRHAPEPYVRKPQRGQVSEQVVALDDLVAWDHPVRAVWSFVERLDLAEIPKDTAAANQYPVLSHLLTALWLWATIEGIGSAHRIARLCQERLSYRWLCGGVAIDHDILAAFRLAHGDVLDRVLTHGLAALIEEAVVPARLLSPEAKASGPADASAARQRLETLAGAAAARVQELRGELDKNDPIADEQYRRATRGRIQRDQNAEITAALALVQELAATQEK